MRRNEGDFEAFIDDAIDVFSRTSVWASPVSAGALWLVCALTVPSIPTLGPVVAGFVLLMGLSGLFNRSRRERMLGRARTASGIQGLTWREFEDLLVELFRSEGFRVEKTAAGADGGADHILRRDQECIVVQAKHWKARRVSLAVVQRTYGVAMAFGATQAMIVTCGRFTPEAEAFAIETSMELVDTEDLQRRLAAQGMAEHVARPRSSPSPPLPGATHQCCPVCDADMTVKRGRYGPFLSCTRFPACRGSRSIEAA